VKPHKTKNKILEYDTQSPYFADFYQMYVNVLSISDQSNNGNGKLTAGKNSRRVIMVTSAMEEEGKSTLASYFALTTALSSEGFHILVDGDLRRPTLHKKFDVELKNGMTEILTDQQSVPGAIKSVRQTQNGGLHLLTAGSMIESPFELLTEKKTRELVNYLKDYYERIIIDSPPLIPVSDTLRLAQLVDGVVLVIRAGKTPKEVIKRAVTILQQAKCKLLGVVLNDKGDILPYYYHGSYYRYSYQQTDSEKG
jgi:capsular exopolysaccharide synthesis family protein